MARSPARQPRLGIILPDDPIASEIHRLDKWLSDRGRTDITALTLFSRIEGGHFEADLLRTGDLDVIGPVAQALGAQGCDAIVWACTSGSFIGGLDWSKAQAAGLSERTGLPASSTTLAFIAALHALGRHRVHLLAAYPDACARAFIGCLDDSGIAVETWAALQSPDGPSSFRLSLADELDRFVATLPADTETPILIPDTAINSLDLVDELEARSGRMVLTANQVTLWHGLTLLGVDTPIARAGRLLAEPIEPKLKETP